MSSVLPPNRGAFMAFAAAHGPVWSGVESQIGLTTAEVTAIKDKIVLAEDAIKASDSSKALAKANTFAANTEVSELRTLMAAAVKKIKGFAQQTGNASVFSIAQIDPPLPPTPSQAPSAPYELTAVLIPSTGALTVKWKSSQPKGVSGVVFVVKRKVGSGAGGYTQLGFTGERSFNDTNIPAGVTGVTYLIEAYRGNQVCANPPTLNVQFGTGSNGETVAIVSTASAKMAA
ncbi:MAG: hypothetical protein Q8L55_09690 [Phycisphaerales bacterium]|nr:hypothetical protein [Phycisphaerales bacterium]